MEVFEAHRCTKRIAGLSIDTYSGGLIESADSGISAIMVRSSVNCNRELPIHWLVAYQLLLVRGSLEASGGAWT